MDERSGTGLAPLERLPTGIEGLDEVIGGGLFRGGIYMVVGRPGSGKTTTAAQVCFSRAAVGDSVLYVTLLTEAHGRLLANLQGFAFFDASRIGREIHFVNGYAAIEQNGLDGLLVLLRQSMRERRAALLVIDGMVTVEALATSPTAYKKFIQELQTWAGLVGCTVLVLTSALAEAVGPEHTMVDGIVELSTHEQGMRTVRRLLVSKFRGCSFLEGSHTYRITGNGLTVYPRFEALYGGQRDGAPPAGRVTSGVAGLDGLLDGGLAPRSMTLVLGSSGAGKTLLGLHFLAAGAAAGEACLHFGFFETPAVLAEKARRIGLSFAEGLASGRVRVEWQSMSEGLLDELGRRLLRVIDEHGAKRLFLDGLVGFEQSAGDPTRLSTFFAVLAEQLRVRGVTALVSAEARQLFLQDIAVPIAGISASFENLILLRQVEHEAEQVHLLTVMKTRDSRHDCDTRQMTLTPGGMALGPARAAGPPGRPPPARKAATKTTKRKRTTPQRTKSRKGSR